MTFYRRWLVRNKALVLNVRVGEYPKLALWVEHR